KCEKDLRIAGFGKEWRLRNRKTGRIKVGIPPPADFPIRGNSLGKTVLKKESVVVMGIVTIVRQRAEVNRAKQLVPGIHERSKEHLALKQHPVIGVRKPL